MNATICECGATCFASTSQWCVTIVDAEDAWLLERYKWSAYAKARDSAHQVKSDRYAKETSKSQYLHQAVTGHVGGPMLDHINRWAHDNRKANLRPCTAAESARNRGKRNHRLGNMPSSKYKGVVKTSPIAWRAEVGAEGQRRYRQTFHFESDAAIAYNYHAAHYHGEFANLNDLSGIEYMHD